MARESHVIAPPLDAGARVALVAPAGPLRGVDDVQRAVANALGLGWEPVVGAHALARDGYFAGDDASRLADLNGALHDDDIDAIWFLRGGYGAIRILERIDYHALRRRPKTLIGFSDITAIHCAVRARTGLTTFHGPTARSELTPFSRESLRRAVTATGDPLGDAPTSRVIRSGSARGRLDGGNIALLSALAGTPFAPCFDGAIVVLEDINEAVYRIDRMMQQLRLAGIFAGCRALVFGACTSCPEESDDGARTLEDVLAETADALGVPCMSGVPVGHIADQWTLPLGAAAELDTTMCRLRVIDVEHNP